MAPQNSPDFVSRQVELSRYLFLDLAPDESARFVLTCAGREECAEDYTLERNGFDYYAVEFVLSGKLRIEWGDAVFDCGPGALFAYRPDSEFRLTSVGSEPLVKYFVDFAGTDAEAQLEASGLEFGVPQLVTPVRGAQLLFDQILDCSRYPKSVAQEMGSLFTQLLLMRIRQDGRSHSLPSKDSFETYERCRGYVRDHFKTLKSMEALSEACHLDRAYLSRLFKKHAGESPYQLLIRMKMEYAAELLRYSHTSVKAVAMEVGYDDPLHFSRVFKKNFGLSPRHFVKG